MHTTMCVLSTLVLQTVEPIFYLILSIEGTLVILLIVFQTARV